MTGLYLGIIAFHLLCSALAWPYAINTGLALAGSTATIVWWQGMLLGCVPGLGQFWPAAVVVAWILSLAIM